MHQMQKKTSVINIVGYCDEPYEKPKPMKNAER